MLRDFWSALKSEELEHASWVDHLSKKAESGEISFEEGKNLHYSAR